ncbi:MAG: YXWGXW repeat-containing protein [Bryobacteraceae bacterium]
MRLHTVRNLLAATFAMASFLIVAPAVSSAGVFVSVSIAPPVLPVYVQPVCPAPGFLWTPGYWGYGAADYYWVPGTWVRPPRVGVLWTPGYWGFGGGAYLWHAGYWGPHVGFYGGVNYGFGYGGVGFAGGRWVGGAFSYNTAVAHVNTTVIHNTYVNRTVINNTTVNRTSFNGTGGVMARPTPSEMTASREEHVAATPMQASHEHAASMNRSQFASVNHGRPSMMATARPGAGMNRNAGMANRPMNHPYAEGAQRNAAPRSEARQQNRAPMNRGEGHPENREREERR